MQTSADCRQAFIKSCFLVLKLYRLLKYYETDEEVLETVHQTAKELGQLMKQVTAHIPVSSKLTGNLDIPKVHAPLHYRYARALVACSFYTTHSQRASSLLASLTHMHARSLLATFTSSTQLAG